MAQSEINQFPANLFRIRLGELGKVEGNILPVLVIPFVVFMHA